MIWVSQQKRRGYQHLSQTGTWGERVRARVVWAAGVLVVGILVARVVYLQLIERDQYTLTAASNHLEVERVVAPRGKLMDRRGKELVKTPATAAITGYLSEVTESELGCRAGLCYGQGMQIGRAGLEKNLEARLRGRDGGRMVEKEASGREVRELGLNAAQAGEDVQLTVDGALTQVMYRVLKNRPGSAVALDLQGKVLGLVSSPAYDPLDLGPYLADSEKLYFFNRAISATYPPGSVFKLVTSIAGLAEGKITQDSTYEDTGEIKVGEYRYGNWYFDQYGRTEGVIGLTRALARSNDIYFYKVGESLGVSKLVMWARKMGLGEITGVELGGEKEGLVPDELWKERKTGEKWFLGNTYHLSIGQGDLLVTPIQVARMTLSAVTGHRCRLSLLQESKPKCENLNIESKYLELVREGMKEACSSGGTAYPLFDMVPGAACKTGTAQHAGQKSESDKPHAWITVAYPAENPELILTVMLESAGEGSAEAGPVAREILEEWKKLK